MAEKLMIFIDGSNFYHGLKQTIGHASVDLSKLITKLTGESRNLIRTYYYNAPVNQFDDVSRYKSQQKFFSFLKRIPGLELKLGRLEKHKVSMDKQGLANAIGRECADKFINAYGETFSTYAEKGVDVQIAVDMLQFAFNNAYDAAILVSGDGDFAGMVQAVKSLGKKVGVAYVEGRSAYHLKQVCDFFIVLDKKYLNSISHKKSLFNR